MATFERFEDIDAGQKARSHGDHLTKTVADASSGLCMNVRENPQRVTGSKWRIQDEETGCQKAKIIGAG